MRENRYNMCDSNVGDKHNTEHNEKNNDNLIIFNTIKKEWRLESKEEDLKYFCYIDEVKMLLNGEKNIVVGRKGEGKTAIAQYIYNINQHDVFSTQLTFKNFPFNKLYELSNSQYTSPNQYISIWKYIIYTTICKLMIKNNNIKSPVVSKLKKLFINDEQDNLEKIISKYTLKGFGLNIATAGISIDREKNNTEIEWLDLIEIFEKIVSNNIDKSKYYIVFDELDEDYKNFDDTKEEKRYFDLLTGLLKAVQDVRFIFKRLNLEIYPIVFLRSDIYSRIKYSDKNKWSDILLKIFWNEEKIKKLLCHRLKIVYGTSDLSFSECWEKIFGTKKVGYGNKQQKKMNSFDYILRSTHKRPRDIIRYLQLCANGMLSDHDIKKKSFISPNLIKQVDDEFSEYLKNEIIDEIYSELPEYEEVFSILSLIRKQTFNLQDFIDYYKQRIEQGADLNKAPKEILKILFEASVIGNVPKMSNKNIFKYESDSAKFNFNEKIIIHRGLYKAFQIY